VNVAYLSDLLRSRSPFAHRIARPLWRVFTKLLFKLGYWEPAPELSYWQARSKHKYYQEVVRLARIHVPSGRQVIDVGANETEILQQLDWFGQRVALDLDDIPPQPGIETLVIDFMTYQPASEFDLVICLQVLEHLQEPAMFARKLLETGRTVIISVPYKWPAGKSKWHVQDPVDEAKLEMWTGRKPDEISVISDENERLIAVYKNQD
jgi:hypothetical protein